MLEDDSQEWIDRARTRIAARGKLRPSTKAGAVRALWPVIEEALANGQSLKRIRDWLEEEGVPLTYNQLTSYVSRIRNQAKKVATALPQAEKEDFKPQTVGASGAHPSDALVLPKSTEPPAHHDPIANIRKREQQRPTFAYDPNFREDDLI